VADSHIRTIVTQDGWKLNLADRDRNQLFNLNKDPWEMNNLFTHSEYQNIINTLRGKIHQWQEDVNDRVDLV
jgi:hypothetical protein